jgi:hypothetical protein
MILDVDIDDWLEANGIEHGRAELTAEELAMLREKFHCRSGEAAG